MHLYHKNEPKVNIKTFRFRLYWKNIGILRMTGEVIDKFDGRTLFYLDNKQFIELHNLSFILSQRRTPLLLGIYLFH